MTPDEQRAQELAEKLVEMFHRDATFGETEALLLPYVRDSARYRWQPIETAPKGEWILLSCGSAGIVEGCYTTPEGCEPAMWMDSYGRQIFGPLHWVPLPDTPDAAIDRARSEGEGK